MFCRVNSVDELQQAVATARQQDHAIVVLGGGSNILFVQDFDGLVIHIAINGLTARALPGEKVQLQVGAGENWHELVMYCLNKNYYGLENMALIPGSVGAAPIQNIGAYGIELGQFLTRVEVLDIVSGELKSLTREACELGYRDSIFKHQLRDQVIVTQVSLQLSTRAAPHTGYGALQEELEQRGQSSSPTPQDVAEAVMDIRRRKLPDPARLPNAGSFFKNPILSRQQFLDIQAVYGDVPGFDQPDNPDVVKVPAAWLLDKLGWKGRRQGTAGVHDQQAVVIVNFGQASGTDILAVANAMQQSVLETFGISLEPEVRIL